MGYTRPTYWYGQKRILANDMFIGRPKVVYVLNREPDWLVRLSEVFPFAHGDPSFFIHESKLDKTYVAVEVGVQGELFKITDKKERLRIKHLKRP